MNMEKLLSRKLLLSLAGVILVAVNRKLHLGLTATDVGTIAAIIIGGVFGLSLPDAAAAWRDAGAIVEEKDGNEKTPVADSGSAK